MLFHYSTTCKVFFFFLRVRLIPSSSSPPKIQSTHLYLFPPFSPNFTFTCGFILRRSYSEHRIFSSAASVPFLQQLQSHWQLWHAKQPSGDPWTGGWRPARRKWSEPFVPRERERETVHVHVWNGFWSNCYLEHFLILAVCLRSPI